MNRLIEVFLAPSGFMYDPGAFLQLLDAFSRFTPAEISEFESAARAMPYDRYTRTVYWGILRGRVVSADPRCRICASMFNLQVHHRSYEHRGSEYAHLQDLEALCQSCHLDQHAGYDAAVKQIGEKLSGPSQALLKKLLEKDHPNVDLRVVTPELKQMLQEITLARRKVVLRRGKQLRETGIRRKEETA